MALYFDKVKLLSYTHSPVLLGAGLRFRIDKKLTIRGYLIDKTSNEPAQALINKEELILRFATDYDTIILEGISFGSGRITNINFEGGVLARDEEYTYEIECYEEGDLFNATSGVYSGLTWASARQIESIDENFEYSENEDGDKSYNHNFSVKYREYTTDAQGINLAKAIAANFFNSTSGLGAYLNNYTNLSGKQRLYTETYNTVDCSASFQEIINIPKLFVGNYSYGLSYDIELDSEGFVNITETVDIQGLTKPPLAGAEEGYLALKDAAYTRSNSVYTAYNFSTSTLYNSPISKSQTKNQFVGTISFSHTYTNNPRYQDFAIWEKTIEISLDRENYYTVTENGSVRGFGRPTLDKYLNAINFYNNVVKGPQVDSRIDALYATTGRVYDLYLINQQFSKNEIEGQITYSYSFTDDDRLSDDDFKKREIDINISNPVHLIQNYSIFNHKEIIQSQRNSSLASHNITINLYGKRGVPFSTYLTEAKNLVVDYSLPLIPTLDMFIDNVSYNPDPINNRMTFSLSYTYVGGNKAFTDISVT